MSVKWGDALESAGLLLGVRWTEEAPQRDR